MSLIFVIGAVDGRFEKQFSDMVEVEAYFGKALRGSDVSDDGVQTIRPANDAAAEALREYRKAATLPEVSLTDRTVFIPIRPELMPTLERALKQKIMITLGDGQFVARGEDNIRLALATLCQRETEDAPITHCRKNVEIFVDHDNSLAYIVDQDRTAKRVGELNSREFVPITSAKLTYHSPVNEDTGAHYTRQIGTFVNQLEDVSHALSQSFKQFHKKYGEDGGGHLDFSGYQIAYDDVFIQPPPTDAPQSVEVEPTAPARPKI